jgi:hypothetical protein
MSSKKVLALASLTAALAACESGDIVLQPTTIDNSVSSGGGSAPTNPCALYEQSGQTRQGALDADNNCVYDTLFVSATRPITVAQLTIPALPNGGLHIFEGSLYVGADVSANDAATGQRIPQEGRKARARY